PRAFGRGRAGQQEHGQHEHERDHHHHGPSHRSGPPSGREFLPFSSMARGVFLSAEDAPSDASRRAARVGLNGDGLAHLCAFGYDTRATLSRAQEARVREVLGTHRPGTPSAYCLEHLAARTQIPLAHLADLAALVRNLRTYGACQTQYGGVCDAAGHETTRLLISGRPASRTLGCGWPRRGASPILGPIGLLLREEPTVRRALASLARYSRLHTDTLAPGIEEDGETAIIPGGADYPGEETRTAVEPAHNGRAAPHPALAVGRRLEAGTRMLLACATPHCCRTRSLLRVPSRLPV